MIKQLMGGMALLWALPLLAQPIEVIPIEPAPPPPSTPNPGSISTGQRFSCQFQNGQYVVSYQPESQAGRFFPWALPRTLGGGWSTQRRCTEIARRLEAYRPDGLDELQVSRENGYDTVCATTDRISNCRIVFTVPPGQDPLITRDQVFSNLVSSEQGQLTTPVNTFTGRNNRFSDLFRRPGQRSAIDRRQGIDLKPFLSPRDGGTGSGL